MICHSYLTVPTHRTFISHPKQPAVSFEPEPHQAWALWDCIADDSLGKDVWHDPAFKIYRGLGNLVLLVYMWGVNIWVSEGERGTE